MIGIVDDLVDIDSQNGIEEHLLSTNFPWYFLKDVTSNSTPPDLRTPALNHSFFKGGILNSLEYAKVAFLPMAAAAHMQVELDRILAGRAFLQLPLAHTASVDKLHVDSVIKHIVLLYYVCDSDGDTLIVDKRYEGGSREVNLDVNDFEIIKRVTPKKGRAVLFDGSYYHTAEQPVKNIRCILNFNLLIGGATK